MERSEITKRRKKLGLAVLAGMLSLSMIMPASAVQASSILDEITEAETLEDFSEDTSYSLLRSNNLAYGSAKITKLSSNKINIYGLTQCHHECDNVYLYLYLEQKDDGSYGTYKYWKFDANNVTSLSRSLNVIVPSGHYYRVRGYHAAKDGSKESTETLTQGILVK